MPYGISERPEAARLLCEDAVLLGRDVLVVSRPLPLPVAQKPAESLSSRETDWMLELYQDDGEVVRVLFAEEEVV